MERNDKSIEVQRWKNLAKLYKQQLDQSMGFIEQNFIDTQPIENRNTEPVKSNKKRDHKNIRPTASEIIQFLTEKGSDATGKEIIEAVRIKYGKQWKNERSAIHGIKLSVKNNDMFTVSKENESFEERRFDLTARYERSRSFNKETG